MSTDVLVKMLTNYAYEKSKSIIIFQKICGTLITFGSLYPLFVFIGDSRLSNDPVVFVIGIIMFIVGIFMVADATG